MTALLYAASAILAACWVLAFVGAACVVLEGLARLIRWSQR